MSVVTFSTVDLRTGKSQMFTSESIIISIVTGQTDIGRWAGQQPFTLTLMRVVAGQTFTIRSRGVSRKLCDDSFNWFVTSKTESFRFIQKV